MFMQMVRIGLSWNMVIPVEKELEFPLAAYWKFENKPSCVSYSSMDGKLYLERVIREGPRTNFQHCVLKVDPDTLVVEKETCYNSSDYSDMFFPRYGKYMAQDTYGALIWHEDGVEKWRYVNEGHRFGVKEIIGDEMVVRTGDKNVILELESGRPLRETNNVGTGRHQYFDDNSKFIHCTKDTKVVCRDFRTFEALWEFDWKPYKQVRGAVSILPLVMEGRRLYCQAGSRDIVCLDIDSGGLVWKAEIDDSRSSSLFVKDGKLYSIQRRDIACFDGATGELIYRTVYKKDREILKYGYIWGFALVVGKYFLSNDNGCLLSVADLDTGEVIWEVPKKGHLEGGMMFMDGKLLICSKYNLWCFGPKEGQPAEARKKRLGNNLKWEDLRLLP